MTDLALVTIGMPARKGGALFREALISVVTLAHTADRLVIFILNVKHRIFNQ